MRENQDHDDLPQPQSLQQPKRFLKTAIGACVKAPAALLVYSADAVISAGSMAMLALSSSGRKKPSPRELELAELASSSSTSLAQDAQGGSRPDKQGAEPAVVTTRGSTSQAAADTSPARQPGSLSGGMIGSPSQQSFLAAEDAMQQGQLEQMEVQDKRQWQQQRRRQRPNSPLDDTLVARPPSQPRAPLLPPSGDPQLDRYLQYLLSSESPHRYLYYSGWQLTQQACVALAAFIRQDTRVKTMNLSSNQLRDEGTALLAAALAHNKVLLGLDLNNNMVSDAGAVALAESLQANSTLTELQLNDNLVGDEGADALASALRCNTSLCRLGLNKNKVSSQKLRAEMAALKYRMPGGGGGGSSSSAAGAPAPGLPGSARASGRSSPGAGAMGSGPGGGLLAMFLGPAKPGSQR